MRWEFWSGRRSCGGHWHDCERQDQYWQFGGRVPLSIQDGINLPVLDSHLLGMVRRLRESRLRRELEVLSFILADDLWQRFRLIRQVFRQYDRGQLVLLCQIRRDVYDLGAAVP